MKKIPVSKLLVISALIFSISSPCSIAYAQHTSNSPQKESYQICRADEFTWIYKEINGKLYRRLYNITQRLWVGDWILV